MGHLISGRCNWWRGGPGFEAIDKGVHVLHLPYHESACLPTTSPWKT